VRIIVSRLLLAVVVSWTVLVPVPAAALGAAQLAIVINTADPYSVEVGQYYARKRGIPPANVVYVTRPVGQEEISRRDFEVVKAEVDARVPVPVQALALAWTTPFRVDCLSITTAFAFGFDQAFCAQGCMPTRPSPYFDSPSEAPFRDLRRTGATCSSTSRGWRPCRGSRRFASCPAPSPTTSPRPAAS
jgi:hypothetical protein